MIRFIIKSVFWLSLAFIIMPKIINSDTDQAQRQNAKISLPPKEQLDNIIATSQTAAEVGGFCFNNSDLCIEGKNMLLAAGSGLLDGSGKLLDFLSHQFGAEKTKEVPVQDGLQQSPDHSSENRVPLPRHRPQ